MTPLSHGIWKVVAPLARTVPAVRGAAEFLRSKHHLVHHSAAKVFPALIRPHTVNLTVAITASCNQRCKGCLYERGFMTGQQLSLTMMNDLLEDAAALGVRQIRLYGGEPLLHPDLPAMVRRSIELGLRTYVTTNGVLIRERVDELFDAGLRDFTIGFYGTGHLYDEYVQRKRNFERLERSLDYVRSKYGKQIGLRFNWLLMRPTCSPEALAEAVAFAQRYEAPMQVDLIHYSLPYFTEGPERELQFRPEDRPAIDRLVDALLTWKRSHPSLIQNSEPGIRSIPDWLLLGADMKVACDKYRMVWVGADGSVQLCYVTFKLGSLHQHRLRDMLYTKEHVDAARGAFELKCPNCHCGFDDRVRKDAACMKKYS